MNLKKKISPAALYTPENHVAWEHKEARNDGVDTRDLGMVAAEVIDEVDPTQRKAMRAADSRDQTDPIPDTEENARQKEAWTNLIGILEKITHNYKDMVEYSDASYGLRLYVEDDNIDYIDLTRSFHIYGDKTHGINFDYLIELELKEDGTSEKEIDYFVEHDTSRVLKVAFDYSEYGIPTDYRDISVENLRQAQRDMDVGVCQEVAQGANGLPVSAEETNWLINLVESAVNKT